MRFSCVLRGRTFLFSGGFYKIHLDINKRITKIRKLKGLTQSQLAEKLGCVSSSYSQMERIGKIPAFMARDIADILNIDVRYFLYDEEYMKNIKDVLPENPEPKPEPKPNLVLTKKETEIIKLLRFFDKEERAQVDEFIAKIYNEKRERARQKKMGGR